MVLRLMKAMTWGTFAAAVLSALLLAAVDAGWPELGRSLKPASDSVMNPTTPTAENRQGPTARPPARGATLQH